MGDSGLNIIAKGAYQGGVVDMCANNIGVVEKATGSGTGNEVSFERIANWNPGVILFATNGKDAGDFYDAAGTDPTWASLDAIQSGSYYQVPKTPYNWLSSPPSVNQVLGMQWLPRVLYPGKFSTSVTDVAKDYYKTFFICYDSYGCRHRRADGSRRSVEVGCELLLASGDVRARALCRLGPVLCCGIVRNANCSLGLRARYAPHLAGSRGGRGGRDFTFSGSP